MEPAELSVIAGEIIASCTNYPGSWHDSQVAQGIYEKLDTETPDGFSLVADSAFPQGYDCIAGKIRVPLKAGEKLPMDAYLRQHMLTYSRAILSYRQTAEWGMREIQGRFGRLRIPLEIEDTDGRADLIETCFRLHNLRARRVGINHIRNVYVPVSRDGDSHVWEGFEQILFPAPERPDRVSSFHVREEWY